MPVTIDLTGKTALVTGAARGIGAEIARMLHRAGANVHLNYPGPADGEMAIAAGALAEELNAQRAGSTWLRGADVSSPESVQEMVASIQETGRGLDILVNNAGILRDRSIAKMTLDEWEAVLKVNLFGVFHVCKFALPLLREGGSIVNIGSLAATAGFHGQANYAAAKAGVHALTRVLARECARRSIRANAVAPGVIDTQMMQQVAPEVREGMVKSIPLGRLGTASEVAAVVLFLCSDLATYVTGNVVEVNGGWRG